jgi:hypothetical protein
MYRPEDPSDDGYGRDGGRREDGDEDKGEDGNGGRREDEDEDEDRNGNAARYASRADVRHVYRKLRSEMRLELGATRDAAQKHLPVAALGTPAFNAFVRNVMLCLIFQFLVTISMTWLLTQTLGAYLWIHSHPLIAVPVLLVLAAFYLAFVMFGRLSDFSTATQVSVLLVINLTMSVVFSAIIRFGDVVLFVEGLGLTAILFASIVLFTMQSRWRYYSSWCSLWVICAATAAGFVFVYYPNMDFFAHPSLQWVDNMHRGTWHILLLIVVTTLFALYVLYDLEYMLRNETPKDMIYVTMRIYLDIVIFSIFTMETLVKCSCARQPLVRTYGR